MNMNLLSKNSHGGTDREGTTVPDDFVHIERLTAGDIMQLIVHAGLKKFDNADFELFSGVNNTEEAKIAYFGYSNGCAIIVDGDDVEVTDGNNSVIFSGLTIGELCKTGQTLYSD